MCLLSGRVNAEIQYHRHVCVHACAHVRAPAAASQQIKSPCGQFALPNVRSPPKAGITRSLATVATAKGSAAMHAKFHLLRCVCECVRAHLYILYEGMSVCVFLNKHTNTVSVCSLLFDRMDALVCLEEKGEFLFGHMTIFSQLCFSSSLPT